MACIFVEKLSMLYVDAQLLSGRRLSFNVVCFKRIIIFRFLACQLPIARNIEGSPRFSGCVDERQFAVEFHCIDEPLSASKPEKVVEGIEEFFE